MGGIILDLCGGSGSWSKPYAEAGYDVRIIDPIQGTGDVRLYVPPRTGVRGILAAPPCTYFAVSGNRWKRTDEQMKEALSIVDACLRIIMQCQADAWWAMENPVGTLQRYIGKPAMYFQPYEYGDPYTKKTCLWGIFNKPIKRPVEPTEGSKMWAKYGGKSAHTKYMRSLTPPGFAQAFFEANR